MASVSQLSSQIASEVLEVVRSLQSLVRTTEAQFVVKELEIQLGSISSWDASLPLIVLLNILCESEDHLRIFLTNHGQVFFKGCLTNALQIMRLVKGYGASNEDLKIFLSSVIPDNQFLLKL